MIHYWSSVQCIKTIIDLIGIVLLFFRCFCIWFGMTRKIVRLVIRAFAVDDFEINVLVSEFDVLSANRTAASTVEKKLCQGGVRRLKTYGICFFNFFSVHKPSQNSW